MARKFTPVRLLKEGMIIDQSIIDSSGHVLLYRKTVLDEYYVYALQNMGIGGVYITDKLEDDPVELKDITVTAQAAAVIEKTRKADVSKLVLQESVKQRVNEGMQSIYQEADSETIGDTAHGIADELMTAISKNDALAVDINELKVSDEYTFKHSVDVASISMIIAKRLGMSDEHVQGIGVAGLLHDIGKSKIPNEVLNKPGKLTDEEFDVMKKHPLIGYEMLNGARGISNDVRMGVLQHHEKSGGNGYPLGIPGDRIHEYAKILTVADVYDALVTERPYKKAFTPRDAVEMLLAMTNDIDIMMINGFLRSVILYPVDSVVRLTNGEVCKVVKNIQGYPMRPTVVSVSTGKIYDLSGDFACNNILVE